MDHIAKNPPRLARGRALNTLTLSSNNVLKSNTTPIPAQEIKTDREGRLWDLFQECKYWFERNPSACNRHTMQQAFALWRLAYTMRGAS